MNNPAVKTFNPSAITPTEPQKIDLDQQPIYASVDSAGNLGPAVAVKGGLASGFSSSLQIASIQLAVTAGSGTSYTANWLVNFDNTKTVRPIRPVSISTRLSVDQTTSPYSSTSAHIVTCQGAGAPSHYEGAQNVSGGTCGGTYSGGFCSMSFVKHISFGQPFAGPPQVIVSPRIDSIFTFAHAAPGPTIKRSQRRKISPRPDST